MWRFQWIVLAHHDFTEIMKKLEPASGSTRGAAAVPSAAPMSGARHRTVVSALVTRGPPERRPCNQVSLRAEHAIMWA